MNSPVNIDQRIAAWHAEGWSHFNSHTAPLSVWELETERQRARDLKDRVSGVEARR